MSKGDDRKSGSLAAVSCAAVAVAVAGLLASCYPDFQFGGTSTSSASSTGAGRPGTSSSGSAGGSTSTTGPGTTSSSKSSSSGMQTASSSTGMSGPPCAVTGNHCPIGEACCFDLSNPPNDVCAGTCPGNHLSLRCATDAECTGGKHCCAIFDILGSLTSTTCRTDCSAFDAYNTCNPAEPTCSTCAQLLGSYFTSNMASPPYDLYGQCN